MSPTIKTIPQADAEYHLELLLDMAEDLFQRHAYFALWRIRWWDYQGFTDDYFHWPYDDKLSEISFIEELNWVLHEPGHQAFEDAYASHLRQACKPVVAALSSVEDSVMTLAVHHTEHRSPAHFEIKDLIEQRLLNTIMNIVRTSDMQGIREHWTTYGLAFEIPDDGENR